MIYQEETGKIIQCAIKVHRRFGPGLLESAYRICLYYELCKVFSNVRIEISLPIIYEKIKLDHGYRIDLLVNDKIVIELKSVESLNDVHFAQVLTYLKVGNYPLGLLINFNVKLLRTGVRRILNNNRLKG